MENISFQKDGLKPGSPGDLSVAGSKLRQFNVFIAIIILIPSAILLGLQLLGFINNIIQPSYYFQYDFGAYYVAAATLNKGEPLYDDKIYAQVAQEIHMQTGYSTYIYPPFFAVLMRPLASIPQLFAILVWAACNLMFLALSIRQLFIITGFPFEWPMYIAALLIALTFPPVFQNLLVFGQVNLLLLWLLLLLCSRVETSISSYRDWIAGIALGIATGIKLFMGALIPYMWVFRRRKIATIAAAFSIITVLVGSLGASWSDTVHYFTTVFRTIAAGENLFWINYSLSATINRMFTNVEYEYRYFFMPETVKAHILALSTNVNLGNQISRITILVLLAISASTLVVDWLSQWRQGESGKLNLRVSFLIVTISLIMPLSWGATQVILLLPIALILTQKQGSGKSFELEKSIALLAWGLVVCHHLWPLLNLIIQRPLPFWVLTLGPSGVLVVWCLLLFKIWADNPSALTIFRGTKLQLDDKI